MAYPISIHLIRCDGLKIIMLNFVVRDNFFNFAP